ncbi:MAG: hypothetical protein HY321_01205 [Armatimonadetes bacterium]|nr:hypothetical protein [Armatimonadota bacterium]
MERDENVARQFNAFLKHTGGKCPIIAYIEPVLPAVKCIIEHRLASGVAHWATYQGSEVGSHFVGYQMGERTPQARKESLGPGGVKFKSTLDWDEIPRPENALPLDAPIEHIIGMPPESIALIKESGLFFYSFLAFDDGRVDPVTYLETFGERWIPGLLSEEDASLYPHVRRRHAEKALAGRDEAYREAREFIRKHFEEARPYGISGSGVAWFQGASITGQRRWDHELAVGNLQVQTAMLRGVSRQHGIPFIIYSAPWGYTPEGYFGLKIDPETPFGKLLNFPTYTGGKPEHLLERQWYHAWFSGSAAVVIEDAFLHLFKRGKDKDTFELGRMAPTFQRLNRLAFESSFDRGTPYRPAAILMDERHGWQVPQSPDSGLMMERRKIWGIWDFTDADVMVDNFFGAIYPGYERAGAYGDGYGDLAHTPYGDSFDVLMSNAGAGALSQYPVLFIVGQPALTAELKERLERYVSQGGTLVLNMSQVAFEWQEFLGVAFSPKHNAAYTALGALRVSDYSEWLSPRLLLPERRFRYTRLEATDAEVLALTEQGDPLVLRHGRGNGQVYLVTAHFAQEISGQHRPDGLLNIARHLIGHLLSPHQKMRVRGPDLHYMVNETAEGLSMMLLNDRSDRWNGWITFPGLGEASAKEWYEEERLHIHRAGGDLSVRFDIPAYSIRLLSVGECARRSEPPS